MSSSVHTQHTTWSQVRGDSGGDILPCDSHSCIKVKGSHGLRHLQTPHILKKQTQTHRKKHKVTHLLILHFPAVPRHAFCQLPDTVTTSSMMLRMELNPQLKLKSGQWKQSGISKVRRLHPPVTVSVPQNCFWVVFGIIVILENPSSPKTDIFSFSIWTCNRLLHFFNLYEISQSCWGSFFYHVVAHYIVHSQVKKWNICAGHRFF